MRQTLNRATILALALATSSCDLLNPRACTLIGCPGLVVEIGNAPAHTPISVVLTAPNGSSRSASISCASGTCPIAFHDFTPATVTIRISAEDRSSEITVHPVYEITHPNGRRCPPECRNARITVTL